MKKSLFLGILFVAIYLDVNGANRRVLKSIITLREQIDQCFKVEAQAYQIAFEAVQKLHKKKHKLELLKANFADNEISSLESEIYQDEKVLSEEKLPNILKAFSQTKIALRPYERFFSIDYFDDQKYRVYAQLCDEAFDKSKLK